jgi:hypothetical protein
MSEAVLEKSEHRARAVAAVAAALCLGWAGTLAWKVSAVIAKNPGYMVGSIIFFGAAAVISVDLFRRAGGKRIRRWLGSCWGNLDSWNIFSLISIIGAPTQWVRVAGIAVTVCLLVLTQVGKSFEGRAGAPEI